jgi:hypothetical protein
MSQIEINSKIDSETTTYILKGAIDERADFSIITPATQNVILDFDGITSINSYGVKKWVLLLNSLKDKNIIYENCPTVLVEQINVIKHLNAGIKLLSFYLPFGCDSCDVEVDKLVTMEDVKEEGFMDSLDELYDCERCRSHLEFLDDEDIYFSFLD